MESDYEITAATSDSPVAENERVVELSAEADHAAFATSVANIVVSEIIDEAMEIVENGLAAGEVYNATHSEEDLRLARMASEASLKEAAAKEEPKTTTNSLGVLLEAADLVARAIDRGVYIVGQVHAEVEAYWAGIAAAHEVAAALIMLHEQAPAGPHPMVVEQVAGCSLDQAESVPSVEEQVAGCSLDQVESVPLAEAASTTTIEELEQAVNVFISQRYIPRKSKIPYRSLPLTKPPSVVAPVEIEMPGDVKPSPGFEPFVEIEPPAEAQPSVVARANSLESTSGALQDHSAQAPVSDPLLPAVRLVSHEEVLTQRSRNVQGGEHGSGKEVAETFCDADSGDPLHLNLSLLSVSDDSYESDLGSDDEEFLSALSFHGEGDELTHPGGSGDDVKVGQEHEEDTE